MIKKKKIYRNGGAPTNQIKIEVWIIRFNPSFDHAINRSVNRSVSQLVFYQQSSFNLPVINVISFNQ